MIFKLYLFLNFCYDLFTIDTGNKKGKIGELKVELLATEKGYIVSRPVFSARYDLILDDGNKIIRAQVKTLNCFIESRPNLVYYKIKKDKNPYSNREIDVIFFYLSLLDVVLKVDNFHNRKIFKFNLKDKTNKNYYEKFIW